MNNKSNKLAIGVSAVVLLLLLSKCGSGGNDGESFKGSYTPTLNSGYTVSTPKTTTTTKSETTGEKNALISANNYLRHGTGLSKKGLEGQLDYEGFTPSEISYAISNCGADWNKQAAKSAKNYLNSGIGFSRSGLIDQLVYEGFTYDEAEYGAKQNGY